MIVCESDLAPYRRAYQTDVIGPGVLSEELFTFSDEYFDLNHPRSFVPSPDDSMTVAVVFAFRDRIPVLSYGLPRTAIFHQAGGHACEKQYLVTTELDVPPALYEGLCRIALDRWPGQRAGWTAGASNRSALRGNMREYAAYRSELAGLGLDYTGDWLTESLYPIDVTQANLDRLCEKKLDLYELGLDGGEREGRKASILVICPNSD